MDEERNRLRSLAEELSDDQLHALPPMTDPDHRATMGVFADLVTPAFLTDRNLSDIMLLAAARLTIEHGICPKRLLSAGRTYSAFSPVIQPMRNLDSDCHNLALLSLTGSRNWD